MQSGKYKDKFYAACFVKQPMAKKDEEGNVVMKEGSKEAEMIMVDRKADMAFWSKVSEKEAIAGLEALIHERGMAIDEERTEKEKCQVVKSIETFLKQSGEKKEEVKTLN